MDGISEFLRQFIMNGVNQGFGNTLALGRQGLSSSNNFAQFIGQLANSLRQAREGRAFQSSERQKDRDFSSAEDEKRFKRQQALVNLQALMGRLNAEGVSADQQAGDIRGMDYADRQYQDMKELYGIGKNPTGFQVINAPKENKMSMGNLGFNRNAYIKILVDNPKLLENVAKALEQAERQGTGVNMWDTGKARTQPPTGSMTTSEGRTYSIPSAWQQAIQGQEQKPMALGEEKPPLAQPTQPVNYGELVNIDKKILQAINNYKNPKTDSVSNAIAPTTEIAYNNLAMPINPKTGKEISREEIRSSLEELMRITPRSKEFPSIVGTMLRNKYPGIGWNDIKPDYKIVNLMKYIGKAIGKTGMKFADFFYEQLPD